MPRLLFLSMAWYHCSTWHVEFVFGSRVPWVGQWQKKNKKVPNRIKQSQISTHTQVRPYVFDGKAVAGIDGSHARSSFSSILDQTNGMLPHGIGQTVHVLAESQTVLKVRLKVARLFKEKRRSLTRLGSFSCYNLYVRDLTAGHSKGRVQYTSMMAII